MKKTIVSTVKVLFIAAAVVIAAVFAINFYVVKNTEQKIYEADNLKAFDADCILILGAGVRDGEPTPMLRDRLLTGIKLYENKAAKKIIMSGDHGSADYDEVNIMRQFALQKGVPEEDIFMDHAGFSTYDSVYRAKKVFDASSIIIVSQKYHLYRALYISEKLSVKACGVSADLNKYGGQLKRDVREILARDKDFFKCITKPKPAFLGDKIPVSGDGRATKDGF